MLPAGAATITGAALATRQSSAPRGPPQGRSLVTTPAIEALGDVAIGDAYAGDHWTGLGWLTIAIVGTALGGAPSVLQLRLLAGSVGS